MEESNQTNLSSFQVVFKNQILEFNYNTSFESYKTQTINSVIQKVLEQLGPKPLQSSPDNYILLCSCGKQFKPDNLLTNTSCNHDWMDKLKNKNPKLLLIEKSKEEQNEENNKNDVFFSNNDIARILMLATGSKKMKNLKVVPENKIPNFPISEDLKNKIKLLVAKKDLGNRLINESCDIKYDENLYNELLEFGIESNKIKAALRTTNNIKQEALLLATDPNYNLDNNRAYLYCDNSEVLSNAEFMAKCKEEIKNEYPNISDNEISNRVKIVIHSINKKDDNKNEDEINDSDEEESSVHEDEDSDEDDSFFVSDSDSIVPGNEFV